MEQKVNKACTQPLYDKVEAITKEPSPIKVSSLLKSCLGLINYNVKFLPSCKSLLAALQRLLHTHTR